MAKKKLKYLMLHCSANVEGSRLTGKDIAAYHTRPKEQGGRGWQKPGYELVIREDGTIDRLAHNNGDSWVDEGEITNGALGYNAETRHLCYIGGLDRRMQIKDTRTDIVKEKMKQVVLWHIKKDPGIQILGHNQASPKGCPSFDVPKWLREIGVPEANIYKEAVAV